MEVTISTIIEFLQSSWSLTRHWICTTQRNNRFNHQHIRTKSSLSSVVYKGTIIVFLTFILYFRRNFFSPSWSEFCFKSMESSWDCLWGGQYCTTNTALHRLQNLHKDDKSISEYLFQAKWIADSLALAGQSISPAEFNAIIFCQLGADFNGAVGALQQRTDPPSFHDLHGQLVAYEILLQSQHSQVLQVNMAHTSSNNNSWFLSEEVAIVVSLGLSLLLVKSVATLTILLLILDAVLIIPLHVVVIYDLPHIDQVTFINHKRNYLYLGHLLVQHLNGISTRVRAIISPLTWKVWATSKNTKVSNMLLLAMVTSCLSNTLVMAFFQPQQKIFFFLMSYMCLI